VLDLTYQIRFEEKAGVMNLLQDLAALPEVEYAERCPLYYTTYTPNDLHSFQWHLSRIEAENAWDFCMGSPEVVLAVVDDAMRVTHEDLAPVIWTNPNEIDGNGLDDDGNGFIDDMHGADVADDDNDPMPPAGASNFVFSHGTHVSGIAVAATDNGTGIASIGFNVRLMPVKTKFDSTISSGGLEATAEGLDYAISTGADVINMSFGGGGASSTWQGMINAGYYKGVTFVAAAGNDNLFKQFFPAAYNHVISVASTDISDKKSSFSNYHYSVDVSAPGSGIYSSVAGGDANYDWMSGTSMSSPLTAGLCALILSADTSLTPDQVEHCLTAGCVNIDALNPGYAGFLGWGRINAANSLACASGVSREEGNTLTATIGEAFPQPAQDEVIFAGEFQLTSHVEVTLMDMQGRLLADLFSGTVEKGTHIFRCSRNPEISAGMYLALFSVNGVKVARKVRFR
jgi:subtilisin family serine protease